MVGKPTYRELEDKLMKLEQDAFQHKLDEKALRERERRYRQIVKNAPVGIYEIDFANNRFVTVNDVMCDYTGYTRREFLSLSPFDILTSDSRMRFAQRLRKILAGEKVPETVEYKIKGKNGIEYWVMLHTRFVYKSGIPERATVVVQNITGRKLTEAALSESEERYRALFEDSKDAIAITDPDGNFLDINKSALDLFGYTRAEILNINFRELYLHPRDGHKFQQEVELKGSVRDYAVQLAKKDGKEMTCLLNVTAKRAKNGSVLEYQGIIRDITEQRKMEQALRENEKKYKALSITDGLTELHNSRHFFSILKKEIERAKRYDRALSLILLDIDNFKQYNDQYGHMEGDRVLARLGRIILANLRDADSAYRYGGEEFTVLLPETDAQEAVTVAERIRKRIGAEVFSPRLRTEINKTVSIGIARYHPGEELSAFVKRADKAMYTAKQQGKNRTVFLDESHPEEHRLVQKGVKRKPETTIEYTLKPGY